MRGFSKAIIAGNVTRDPEMRTTPSGSQVCSFAIAVNRSYKDSSGAQQDQVSYLDCVAWGKSAEIISQYIKKGSQLLVSGRLEQRSWEDKNSGQRRSRTEIVVEDFSFIGGNNNGGNGGVVRIYRGICIKTLQARRNQRRRFAFEASRQQRGGACDAAFKRAERLGRP